MSHTPHLTAFIPGHIGSPPTPPAQRNGWGVVDFDGIPSMPAWALDDTHRPLFCEQFEKERDEAMASICEQLKQRMAEKCGGTWAKD